MTAFLTCRSCVDRRGCNVQNKIRTAIAGQHITSLHHTCTAHELPFGTGQAIWARIQECPAETGDGSYEPSPSKHWFPGHFVGVSSRSNTRGLAFIPYEAPARHDQNIQFYPIIHSPFDGKDNGAVCKVIWGNIEARDGAPVRACPNCGQLEGMKCEGLEEMKGSCPLRAVA